MSDKKSLNLMIMDPPYESSNTMTAFRIIESALKKGIDVTAFAFEGAVNLSFAEQKPHPNPVKETSEEEEVHPTRFPRRSWGCGFLSSPMRLRSPVC